MELTSSPKAASAEDVVLTKDELENLRPVGIDYPPPWRRFWNRCCIASCIVVFCLTIIFFIVLLIGAAVEKSAVDKSDSTIDFYSMPDVCGVSPTGSVVDHPSVASAHAADDLVMHCGSCGYCSNEQDITIYDDTKNTLTTTSTNCAKKAFLGGSKAVYDCFEEDVKFTPDCNDCWTENVMCVWVLLPAMTYSWAEHYSPNFANSSSLLASLAGAT